MYADSFTEMMGGGRGRGGGGGGERRGNAIERNLTIRFILRENPFFAPRLSTVGGTTGDPTSAILSTQPSKTTENNAFASLLELGREVVGDDPVWHAPLRS